MEFGTKEQKAELLSKEHPFQQNQQNHQSSLTRNHTATDLFFSEYSEGSSNNKYLEIYNPTSMTIDLSQYWIFQNSNGGPYTEKMIKLIEKHNVPVYQDLRTWVAAASALAQWGQSKGS